MLPHSCKIHHFKRQSRWYLLWKWSMTVPSGELHWHHVLTPLSQYQKKTNNTCCKLLNVIVKNFQMRTNRLCWRAQWRKNSALVNKLVPLCTWLLNGVLEIPRLRLRLSYGTHADSKLVCVLNAEKDVKINSNYIKINAFDFWNFNIDAAVSNEVAYAWNFSSDVLKPMGTQKLKCLKDISQKNFSSQKWTTLMYIISISKLAFVNYRPTTYGMNN